MEYGFELKKMAGDSSELWTRDLGKKVRNLLNDVLAGVGQDGVVVINAGGVNVFDFSFGNEFFGKTVLTLSTEFPGCILLIENLTEYMEENLSETLKSLNIAMLKREDGKISILGRLHSAYQDTFFLIHNSSDSLTASLVGDKMGISATTANERLTKLAELGLVRREKEVSQAGREIYVYSTV